MNDLELDELAPLVGSAWTLGDRVSAEAVAGLQLLATPAAGDFIVAGLEFGIGDACATAVRVLRAAGIAAVIGRSFAPAFHRAAIDAGLPALVVEETRAVRRGDRLRVDLELHKIANLSSGDRYIIRNLGDEDLEILRAGGLAPLLAAYARTSGRLRH